ncbi:hypothetical protein BDV59DRAFT_207197 [Aspergillus ambiguus]|uniref:uncharacterized protein n=1 Tax=Aspergillus ambiguus TaxID=176160 RepID=UPI003CCE08C3
MKDLLDHNSKAKQLALNFAYMYGYPLLEFGKYVSSFDQPTVNTPYHDRRLSTSEDFKVIRPNADTLYSTIFIDLSSCDLEIIIPQFDDRYWVFPFYDPYGNDIGNIGSLQGHLPGKYLIRYARRDFGFFYGPPLEGKRHVDVQGYINLPTAYGICLARFATAQVAHDQDTVNRYQDKIKVNPVPRHSGAVAPPLQLSLFAMPENQPSHDGLSAEAVLRLTAVLAPYNMSPILQDRRWISDTLRKGGIDNGIFSCPPQADISLVYKFAESQAFALIRGPNGRLDHGNGWSSTFPGYLGNFGSHYAARYYIATRGYLGLTNDQAIYPSRSGSIIIGPKQAILVRFSRRPALVRTGFWSLTAYNDRQYLIPNSINRYCLGSRDQMSFSDGASLGDETKDGEFQILLQPADIVPPTRWLDNWLPAPPGGGKMSITLRWYGAREEMMTGLYEYPRLDYVDAVTAESIWAKL